MLKKHCALLATLLQKNDLLKCREKSDNSGPVYSGTGSPLDQCAVSGPSPYARSILEFPHRVRNPVRASRFPVAAYRFARIRLEGLYG